MHDTPETVAVEIYIAVDHDGAWAAMGYHELKDIQSIKEVRKLLREWNLGEDLGCSKVYKLMVDVLKPSMSEIITLEAKIYPEDIGMLDDD